MHLLSRLRQDIVFFFVHLSRDRGRHFFSFFGKTQTCQVFLSFFSKTPFDAFFSPFSPRQTTAEIFSAVSQQDSTCTINSSFFSARQTTASEFFLQQDFTWLFLLFAWDLFSKTSSYVLDAISSVGSPFLKDGLTPFDAFFSQFSARQTTTETFPAVSQQDSACTINGSFFPQDKQQRRNFFFGTSLHLAIFALRLGSFQQDVECFGCDLICWFPFSERRTSSARCISPSPERKKPHSSFFFLAVSIFVKTTMHELGSLPGLRTQSKVTVCFHAFQSWSLYHTILFCFFNSQERGETWRNGTVTTRCDQSELYPFVSFSRFVHCRGRWWRKLQCDSIVFLIVGCFCQGPSDYRSSSLAVLASLLYTSKVSESEVAVGLMMRAFSRQSWFVWVAVAVCGPLGVTYVQWIGIATVQVKSQSRRLPLV